MPDRWNALHLGQDDLSLVLLPGVGGRLWDVRFRGRSVLFRNPDLEGLPIDDARLADLPTRSPQFGFPLWGGEKTWIAPDRAWKDGAPFPVLDSGAYAVTSRSGAHVEMASAVCPVSALSVTRRITLHGASGWCIAHSVTNHADRPRPTGIWSVMMLDTPATIAVAMETPAFQPVFGSATGMVALHERCVLVDCATRQEFKIGLDNPDGRSVIRCGTGGPWLHCSVTAPRPGDRFAHGYPFEIFNSGDYRYCEAEWHAPARNLAPGDTLHFRQVFRICADSDAARTFSRERNLLSCMS